MLSPTDILLFVLGGAALGAPVAHLLIAYWYAPRKIAQWLESPKGLQAALGAALPTLGASLDSWSKTPEGEAFLDDLVGAIVEKGKDEATKMLGRASGHATQSARRPIDALLSGIKTGNPVLDGIWAMAAPQLLPKLGPMLMRALPQLAQEAPLGDEQQT